MWTRVKDQSALEEALKLARGVYQRNLLKGRESLSGSTLRGTARNYGYWYARSRRNLLDRLTKNQINWSEERGKRNARILVLG